MEQKNSSAKLSEVRWQNFTEKSLILREMYALKHLR